MFLPILASVFLALPMTDHVEHGGPGNECDVSNVAHHYVEPNAAHNHPAANPNKASVDRIRHKDYLDPRKRKRILAWLSLKLSSENRDSDEEEDNDEEDSENDPKNTKDQKGKLKNLVGRKKIKKNEKVIFFEDQEEQLFHQVNQTEDLDYPWSSGR